MSFFDATKWKYRNLNILEAGLSFGGSPVSSVFCVPKGSRATHQQRSQPQPTRFEPAKTLSALSRLRRDPTSVNHDAKGGVPMRFYDSIEARLPSFGPVVQVCYDALCRRTKTYGMHNVRMLKMEARKHSYRQLLSSGHKNVY